MRSDSDEFAQTGSIEIQAQPEKWIPAFAGMTMLGFKGAKKK